MPTGSRTIRAKKCTGHAGTKRKKGYADPRKKTPTGQNTTRKKGYATRRKSM